MIKISEEKSCSFFGTTKPSFKSYIYLHNAMLTLKKNSVKAP